MKELTKQWLKQADYDLKTAEAMLHMGRYLYVAFMSQQAIEKLLKGIICEIKNQAAPYTHRLVALLEVSGIPGDQEQLDFLDLLTRYYINSRYPEQKQGLAKALNKANTTRLFKKTKDCFQWLKSAFKTPKKS